MDGVLTLEADGVATTGDDERMFLEGGGAGFALEAYLLSIHKCLLKDWGLLWKQEAQHQLPYHRLRLFLRHYFLLALALPLTAYLIVKRIRRMPSVDNNCRVYAHR